MASSSTGKPKAQANMDSTYSGMTTARRMELAVKAVLDRGLPVSEAARKYGLTRARVSQNVNKHRKAVKVLQDRAAAAAAERAAATLPVTADNVAEKVSAQATSPVGLGEVRRIEPFPEFARKYFAELECPDCGRHHEIPGFHDEMMQALAGPDKRLLINCPPYHAKVLALDTPIPTPDGWTTIGKLRVGDDVFDKDGKVCQVKAMSPIIDCTKKVVLGDGSEFITDKDHRWWVEARRTKKQFFTTTADLENVPHLREYRIPLAGPLELAHADLPVDPYVLGAWLGDGSAGAAVITAHPDDQPHMLAQLVRAGYTPWAVDQRIRVPGGLLADLRSAGVLFGKLVPPQYLRASAPQRLALLQGLMDTDGTVNTAAGNVSFTNTNPALAGAVFELAASLGWKPRRYTTDAKLNGTVTGVAHVVAFCPARHESPFRMERKTRLLPEVRTRQKTRPFTSIEDVPPVPGRCIAVTSPTETFLAGKAMVPTGNSTVSTVWHSVYELCRDPNSRILIVSKTDKLASRFLYQIGKHLTDPSLYPKDSNLILDWGPFTGGDQWSKTQLYIAGRNSAEKDPSVSALGVGGHIYGVRADIIKFDDIADLENQRNSDRVAEMLVWATQEAASRVGRNGKLQFVGTRISAGDIYSQLETLPAFRTMRWPCITDEDTKATLWPDHFPYDNAVMQRDSMSVEQWQLVYQNVDTPGFGASFPPEVVEATYDTERSLGEYEGRWALIAGLDPAGAGEQAGYTALVLMGVDLETGRRHLVDMVNVKQMKAPQLRDQIFDWADRYPLRELRVESNGLQSQLVQYNTEIVSYLTGRGTRVVPHITTKHNKWDPNFGVEAMSSMFVNRMVTLPMKDIGSRTRVRQLADQLISFPMGQVSDLVMAFWFAELGCKETFQRAAIPMVDPRVRLPPRLQAKRHVVDFGTRTVRPMPDEQHDSFGRQMFPSAEGGQQVRLVNTAGSIWVP